MPHTCERATGERVLSVQLSMSPRPLQPIPLPTEPPGWPIRCHPFFMKSHYHLLGAPKWKRASPLSSTSDLPIMTRVTYPDCSGKIRTEWHSPIPYVNLLTSAPACFPAWGSSLAWALGLSKGQDRAARPYLKPYWALWTQHRALSSQWLLNETLRKIQDTKQAMRKGSVWRPAHMSKHWGNSTEQQKVLCRSRIVVYTRG